MGFHLKTETIFGPTQLGERTTSDAAPCPDPCVGHATVWLPCLSTCNDHEMHHRSFNGWSVDIFANQYPLGMRHVFNF